MQWNPVWSKFRKSVTTLVDLEMNKLAEVTEVTSDVLSAKLTEMGLYQGKKVFIAFKAPFGDPIAVDIEGYVLSLRRNEARLVQVREI